MSHYFSHPTAVIDDNCQIGCGTKIWHFSHIMSHSTIGRDCNIGQNVVVSPYVVVGDNVKIQNNVSLYTGLSIEDDVFIGPSVVFTNVINPRSFIDRKDHFSPTSIHYGASIGANATVICGIEIGRWSMIGAGAVVVKNIPDFALVVGNPSRQIGWVSRYGHRLIFDNEGIAHCPETHEQYILKDKIVSLLSEM